MNFALVRSYSDRKRLKVELAIFVRLHKVEHIFPIFLTEAHVSEIVGQTPVEFNFCEPLIPRDINLSKCVCQSYHYFLALGNPSHFREK